MGYFDKAKNVHDYIRMAEGYDGSELIGILEDYLPPGSSVLELGMGPGKDLDLLAESFRATGSDISRVFLDLYRRKHPDADLLQLDAVTLETDRKFDCLYSNKVLIHLRKDELAESLIRQREALNDDGILFHSFWWGDREEEMHGLRFVYYTEAAIRPLVGDLLLEWIGFGRYKEMKKNDSFYMVLKRK